MKFLYARVIRNQKCKIVIGFVLVSLLVYFFLIYIICFCHIASKQMEQDWATSSAISISMDLVAMEILPAILVGGFGTIENKCRGRCGVMWLIVGV